MCSRSLACHAHFIHRVDKDGKLVVYGFSIFEAREWATAYLLPPLLCHGGWSHGALRQIPYPDPAYVLQPVLRLMHQLTQQRYTGTLGQYYAPVPTHVHTCLWVLHDVLHHGAILSCHGRRELLEGANLPDLVYLQHYVRAPPDALPQLVMCSPDIHALFNIMTVVGQKRQCADG